MWEDIENIFVAQYAYNTQLDVTTRDLETTRQDVKGTFFAFLERRRARVTKMITTATKKDQVRMVIKNLQLHLMKHLIIKSLSTFEQLFDAQNPSGGCHTKWICGEKRK